MPLHLEVNVYNSAGEVVSTSLQAAARLRWTG